MFVPGYTDWEGRCCCWYLPFVLQHGAGRECIRHYTTNTIRSWKSAGVIICITVSMRTPREPAPERALRSYGLLPVPIRLPGCNMNLQESAEECRNGDYGGL